MLQVAKSKSLPVDSKTYLSLSRVLRVAGFSVYFRNYTSNLGVHELLVCRVPDRCMFVLRTPCPHGLVQLRFPGGGLESSGDLVMLQLSRYLELVPVR